jgi:hypothetical protein
MQAEKDERFRSESKKKTIFSSFNFEMGNVASKLIKANHEELQCTWTGTRTWTI